MVLILMSLIHGSQSIHSQAVHLSLFQEAGRILFYIKFYFIRRFSCSLFNNLLWINSRFCFETFIAKTSLFDSIKIQHNGSVFIVFFSAGATKEPMRF